MAIKGFLQSTTVLSGLTTIALSAGIYLTPKVAGVANQYFPERAKEIQAWQDLITETCALFAGGSGAMAIAGRVSAKGKVSTPGWLPGPNKSDLEAEEMGQDLALQTTVETIVEPLIQNLTEGLEAKVQAAISQQLQPPTAPEPEPPKSKPPSQTGRAFLGRILG